VSDEDGIERPPRFCTNCGTPTRQGARFCSSCGERLDLQTESSETQTNEFEGENAYGYTAESEAPGDGDNPATGPRADTLKIDYPKAFERIRDLPITVKVVGVVIGALLLLTVLSPLGLIGALIMFVVSFIHLMGGMDHHTSVKGWGIVAMVSLVVVFVCGYSFMVIYGPSSSSSTSSTGSDSNKSVTAQKTEDRRNTDVLVDAAFRLPPKGMPDQKTIKDIWVTDGTATVEIEEMTGPLAKSKSGRAQRDRLVGDSHCIDAAMVIVENNIPIEKVRVVEATGKELATCDVEQIKQRQKTSTGKNKQKQRTTADKSNQK
jgi:hypothetical protein